MTIEKDLLQDIKEYIEDTEQTIIWEWGGADDTVEKFIKEGKMPDVYYKITKLIGDSNDNN